MKGARNSKAKLVDDDIREIRELYSHGARQVDLAEQFGVNQTTISCIVLRKTWTHVV